MNPAPHRRQARLTASKLASRVKSAIATAAFLKKAISQSGLTADLAEATLLQGILSGDVQAAAISTKVKLMNENLRLRQRLTASRLRSEQVKQEILHTELLRSKRNPAQTHEEIISRIKAIYGLES